MQILHIGMHQAAQCGEGEETSSLVFSWGVMVLQICLQPDASVI